MNFAKKVVVWLCAAAMGAGLIGLAQQAPASAIYAVTRRGGLFRSDDGGKNWRALLTGTRIGGDTINSAFASDPGNPLVLLVARTGRGGGKSSISADVHSLYRSTDGGATWSRSDLPTLAGTQLAIDNNRKNIVYLAGGEGVYRPTDSGQNWTLALSGTGRSVSGVRTLGLDPSQPGVVYATLATGLFKSTDYGATWNKLTQSSFSSGAFLGAIAVDPRNSNSLLLTEQGTCFASNGAAQDCGLFRSSNAGKDWERVAIEGRVNNVVFDARNTMVYAAGHVASSLSGVSRAIFHRSADSGKTWTSVTVEPGPDSDLEIALDAVNSSVLYARVTTLFSTPTGTSPLYYVSTNQGATWAQVQISAADIPANDSLQVLETTPAATVSPVAGVTHVSAATFRAGPLAPRSIVSAVGSGLAGATAAAPTDSTLTLGGVRITVTDSAGARWPAPLFFVSPEQINYLAPAQVALGAGSVTIEREGASALTEAVQFAALAPGIFTLNGAGLAAATVLRVSGSNQVAENVYATDTAGAVVARPIDLRPETDQVYLLLYGTGLRAAGAAQTVVTIGGQNAEVSYSGAQGSFAGLDQINVRIPPALAGRGQVEMRVTVSGIEANTANVTIR